MTIIIPPNHAHVLVRLEADYMTDGYSLVTCGVQCGDLDMGQTAAAFAGALIDAHVPQALNSTVRLANVTAYNTETDGVALVNQNGSGSGNQPSVNCALLVHKRTPHRGPRAKARWSWPGMLAEAVFDAGGVIAPANVTALQTLFDRLFTELGDNALSPVILFGDNGISPVPSEPYSITRFQVDGQITTQRRRMRR